MDKLAPIISAVLSSVIVVWLAWSERSRRQEARAGRTESGLHLLSTVDDERRIAIEQRLVIIERSLETARTRGHDNTNKLEKLGGSLQTSIEDHNAALERHDRELARVHERIDSFMHEVSRGRRDGSK